MLVLCAFLELSLLCARADLTWAIVCVLQIALPAQQGPRRQRGQLPGAALARGVPARGRLQGLLRKVPGVVRPVRLPANERARPRGGPAPVSRKDESLARPRQSRQAALQIQLPASYLELEEMKHTKKNNPAPFTHTYTRTHLSRTPTLS